MYIANFSPTWSPAELSALRLDGDVDAHGALANTCDDHLARAQRVLGAYAHRLVLTTVSAIWAYGVGDEPCVHHVSQDLVRVKLTHSSPFVVEQRVFRPGDLWGNVTSPLRTATDVLRSANLYDAEALSTLFQICGLSKEQTLSRLNSLGTSPGLTLAYQRLERLRIEDYPSETR